MSNVNRVILIGRLGRDPEIRYFPDGTPVANLSLATSYSYTDKTSGEKLEKTEWHRVVCRSQQAEFMNEHARKGSLVYVEGRLQTRDWEKEGQKHYTTEVVAERSLLLAGSKRDQAVEAAQQPPEPERDIPF